MKHLLFSFFSIALAALLLSACNGNTSADTAEDETQDSTQQQDTNSGKVTLSEFPASTDYSDAVLKGMTYQEGTFTFDIEGNGYELRAQTPDAGQKMCANSDKGQHLHLIIDDQPYSAQYDAEFEYSIEDGSHYLLAFLSRSYHESIKTPTSYLAQKVAITNNTLDPANASPIEGPMLFYSRPKGTYVGKANTEKVMLDFFLVNLTLGEEYMVRVDVNGEHHFLVKEWKPMFLENLPMGENTVRLTLLDSDMKKVDIPLNPVSRTFTLKPDPAEEATEQ